MVTHTASSLLLILYSILCFYSPFILFSRILSFYISLLVVHKFRVTIWGRRQNAWAIVHSRYYSKANNHHHMHWANASLMLYYWCLCHNFTFYRIKHGLKKWWKCFLWHIRILTGHNGQRKGRKRKCSNGQTVWFLQVLQFTLVPAEYWEAHSIWFCTDFCIFFLMLQIHDLFILVSSFVIHISLTFRQYISVMKSLRQFC